MPWMFRICRFGPGTNTQETQSSGGNLLDSQKASSEESFWPSTWHILTTKPEQPIHRTHKKVSYHKQIAHQHSYYQIFWAGQRVLLIL